MPPSYTPAQAAELRKALEGMTEGEWNGGDGIRARPFGIWCNGRAVAEVEAELEQGAYDSNGIALLRNHAASLLSSWEGAEKLLRDVPALVRAAFAEGHSCGVSAGHDLSPPPDVQADLKESWVSEDPRLVRIASHLAGEQEPTP